MKWGWKHFECHALKVMIQQDHKEDNFPTQNVKDFPQPQKEKKKT